MNTHKHRWMCHLFRKGSSHQYRLPDYTPRPKIAGLVIIHSRKIICLSSSSSPRVRPPPPLIFQELINSTAKFQEDENSQVSCHFHTFIYSLQAVFGWY